MPTIHIDYHAMLDRAYAKRRALVLAMEDLGRRLDRRRLAIIDTDEEIREYQRKIALEAMREVA
jgi:hypothetical protein